MKNLPFIPPLAPPALTTPESALLESKRFLRSTLDALSAHIAILDEHGTIIEVNAAWNRYGQQNNFKGRQRGVGLNYLRVCDSVSGSSSKGAAEVAGGIRAVMAGETDEFHLEYPCHSPRERRWFVVRATRFGGAGPVRVVIAHENITARKLAEDDLHGKTAFLEAQVNSTIDGILVVNPQGRQILQNQRVAELFKIPPHIVDNKDDAQQIQWVANHLQNPTQFVEKVAYLYAHPDETSRDEITLKDGTVLDRYSAPVVGPDGKHYGRIWTFRDITERKRTEATLLERTLLARLEANLRQALTDGGSLAETLRLCCEAVVRHLDGAFARIWILNEPEQMMELKASAGLYTHLNGPHGRVPVGKFKIGLIAKERKPHLTNQVVGDPRVGDQEWAKREGMVAFAGFPLIVQDRLIGVAAMFARHPLTEVTLTALASVANNIALGIERKLAEALLQRQQTELRVLFDFLPAIICFKDAQNRILRVNQRLADSVGKSVEEIEGKSSAEIYPQDAAKYFADDLEVIRSGKPKLGIIETFRDRENQPVWIETNKVPVSDKDGNITGLIAMCQDITERKRAEEVLREKDRVLTESQRLGHIGSWFDNLIGSFSWSDEMYRIYGVSPDTFIPTPESLLGLIHPEDRPGMQAWLAGCAAGANPGEFEFRIHRPDGTMRFIKGNGAAVYLENKLIHMAGTAQDITESRVATQQLNELRLNEEHSRRALAHERELHQIKSRFVSIVSHEFRTPLCIIGMAGTLLKRYSDKMTDAERAGQIEGIQSGVARMTQMMEDLLQHGKFEAGKIECLPVQLDVAALCRQAIAEVSNHASVPRVIEFVMDPAARTAFLDQKILRHILSNLLSNAVKYSAADQPITLAVTLEADTAPSGSDPQAMPGNQIQFKISDAGIGIPAADLPRLFQTFQRAANVGNRPGTGMGLAIVKQFVDLHHGTIRIESTEGKGTTVWVVLPGGSPDESGGAI
jgi:PAS domain S-box-containing protein